MTNQTRPAQLYRLFNEMGELIYIGVAYSASDRAKQHRMSKSWWCEVAQSEIEQFDSREAALAVEKSALQAEKPKYNILNAGGRHPHPVQKWTPDSRLTQAQALRLVESTAALAAAVKERNAAICAASGDGCTLRQISAIVGLSWSGVNKIINKEIPK